MSDAKVAFQAIIERLAALAVRVVSVADDQAAAAFVAQFEEVRLDVEKLEAMSDQELIAELKRL